MQTSVPASCARYSRYWAKSTQASLPVLMKWLNSTPRRRAIAYTAAQTLPLCVSKLTAPLPPCMGEVLNTDAKLVCTWRLRLAKPIRLGPATTMPVVAT
jgi:hypothetical protein